MDDYIEVSDTDYQLLLNPLLNKGTAFSQEEREIFHLFGLIPPETSNIVQQRARSYEALKGKHTDLEKYIYLRDLQDSNETLYYSLLLEHLSEILPIVYTPVVGAACQNFSHIYRRPRGIFIAYPYKDKIEQILANPRFDHVKVIVVSDGERILGLGDQGAGGMGIPIGKLSLYCACSGIHPKETLPILLDTGTNNINLINDPLYIGWRHERIRGQEYDDFIECFIKAIKKRFPWILLQWEDFALPNATRLLEKYRGQLCTFNDDIQGTAAVTLGTLLSAVYCTGIPLHKQRIVIVGAGTAGCGIGEIIIQAMIDEGCGEEQARSQVFLVDREGLLVTESPDLLPFQKKLLKNKTALSHWKLTSPPCISLADVIDNVHPYALLGVSGQAGLFSETIIRKMAKYSAQPIIMPLSNPITHSEAVPSDIMIWTDNRAIIGTGSPFGDIVKNGQLFRVDQTNNVYIFPGMGLGLIAVQARKVSDTLFMVAAKALAQCSPARTNKEANLLPPITAVREVSYEVALAVAKAAIREKLAEPLSDEEIEQRIQHHTWKPEYVSYRLKPK